jgi:hypothetical protein
MRSFANNSSRAVVSLAVAVALARIACVADPTEQQRGVAQGETPTTHAADAGACTTDGGAMDAGFVNPFLTNPYLSAIGYGPSYLGWGGNPLLGGYGAGYGGNPYAVGGYGLGAYGIGGFGLSPYGIGEGTGYGGLPYGSGLGYLGYPGSWDSYLGWGAYEGYTPPGGWPSGYGPGQAPPDGGCN